MNEHTEAHEGEAMATRSIEERVTLLEQQAELNRQTINAMIERENTFIDFLSSAIGQFKMNKIPKLETIENVIKTDDDVDK